MKIKRKFLMEKFPFERASGTKIFYPSYKTTYLNYDLGLNKIIFFGTFVIPQHIIQKLFRV